MKQSFLFAALLGAATLMGSPQKAEAASVISQFFSGELNILSDNSAEFLVNRVGGSTTLDVGDILITMFDIATVEDSSGGGGTNNFGTGGVNEFTGIAAIKIATKLTASNPLLFKFEFAPLDAADKLTLGAALLGAPLLTAEISSWAAGSMVALFDDPTPDYTRVFLSPLTNPALAGPDDGGVTGPAGGNPNGNTVGPTFINEDFLSSTAMAGSALTTPTGGADATKLWEFGFNGTAGEFWEAGYTFTPGMPGSFDAGVTDSMLPFQGVPQSTILGGVNLGVNLTADFTGGQVRFDPVLAANSVTDTFVTAQIAGNANLRGVLGQNTPFDIFDDFNAEFRPVTVPEPGSFALLILGTSLTVGFRFRRHGKKKVITIG